MAHVVVNTQERTQIALPDSNLVARSFKKREGEFTVRRASWQTWRIVQATSHREGRSALSFHRQRHSLSVICAVSTYYRNKYRSTIDLTLTTRRLTVYSMTLFTDFSVVPHYNNTTRLRS